MTYVSTVSVCLARGADENLAGASEDHAGAGAGGHSGQKRGGRSYYLVTLKFKVLLTLICPQNRALF